jgi:hypothetical protein
MYSYNLATNVYKETEVTYGEVAQALIQLGFNDESTPELFLFVREARKIEVRLPFRPDDTVFAKINTLGFSNILFMQGIIKHPDNLVKMIVKNRLPMSAKREMA